MSTDPPQPVARPLWDWMCAHYGEEATSRFDPLVSVIFAARRAAHTDGSVSEDMLRWWSQLIDDMRRLVDNSEKNFIEQARQADWNSARAWIPPWLTPAKPAAAPPAVLASSPTRTSATSGPEDQEQQSVQKIAADLGVPRDGVSRTQPGRVPRPWPQKRARER